MTVLKPLCRHLSKRSISHKKNLILFYFDSRFSSFFSYITSLSQDYLQKKVIYFTENKILNNLFERKKRII